MAGSTVPMGGPAIDAPPKLNAHDGRTDGAYVTSTRGERKRLTRGVAKDLADASRNTEVLGHIHPRSRRRLVEAQMAQAEAIDPQAQAAADALRLKAQAIAEGGEIPADAVTIEAE